MIMIYHSTSPELESLADSILDGTQATAQPAPNYATMTIAQLASVIAKDWTDEDGIGKVHFAAVPYLDAMHTLQSIDDTYFCESGHTIVTYFLGNAQTWLGDTARKVKAELNKRLQ